MDNRDIIKEANLDEGKSRLINSVDTNAVDLSSSKRGIFNQILLTLSILILTAGCGMPIGYSVAILPQLQSTNTTDPLRMTAEIGSWFASVHSLAVPIGSFSSGPIMDYFGRKPALIGSSVPLLFGWLFIACSSYHWMLITGRILAGLGVGLMGAPCQILIAECVDPKIRGFTVGAPYISYALGILLIYTLGALLNWRIAAWCCIVLPIISVGCLCLVPESPTWLVQNGKLKQAKEALKWLRCNDKLMQRDFVDLVDRIRNDTDEKSTKLNSGNKSRNLLQLFQNNGHVLKPLFIINAFHLFLLFSGTYLVVFYAVDIISEAGVNINSMAAAVYTALVRLLFTVIFCILLFYVQRRTLITIAGIGSTLCSLLLGAFIYFRLDTIKTSLDINFTAICILFYVAFNTGFMVMPGIMIAELIPARVRGRCAGLIYATFNLFLFFIIKLFPQLNTNLKTYGIFGLFGVSSLFGTILTYLMLPETKSVSLGHIEDYFKDGGWFWITRKKITVKSNPI